MLLDPWADLIATLPGLQGQSLGAAIRVLRVDPAGRADFAAVHAVGGWFPALAFARAHWPALYPGA